MSVSTDTRSERFLRFSRRSTITALVLVLVFGALALAMALRPELGMTTLLALFLVFDRDARDDG